MGAIVLLYDTWRVSQEIDDDDLSGVDSFLQLIANTLTKLKVSSTKKAALEQLSDGLIFLEFIRGIQWNGSTKSVYPNQIVFCGI